MGRRVRGWRCHVRKVFGTPDLAWQRRRIAVFIDSAWWHGHPSRWTPGRLSPWWDAKIGRNRERDLEVNRRLAAEGWTVVRLWDFEVDKELGTYVARVERAIRAPASRRSIRPSPKSRRTTSFSTAAKGRCRRRTYTPELTLTPSRLT